MILDSWRLIIVRTTGGLGALGCLYDFFCELGVGGAAHGWQGAGVASARRGWIYNT